MATNLLRYCVARIKQEPGDITAGRQHWGMATLLSPELAITNGDALHELGLTAGDRANCWVDFPHISDLPELEAKIELYDQDLDLALLHLAARLESVPSQSTVVSHELPPIAARFETLCMFPPAYRGLPINGQIEEAKAVNERRLIALSLEEPPPDPRGVNSAPVLVDGELVGVIWSRRASGDADVEASKHWNAMPIGVIQEFMNRSGMEAMIKGLGLDKAAAPQDGDQSRSQSEHSPDLPASSADAGVHTAEFASQAFFDRLNYSSRLALYHAEGIRRARNRNEIHLEYLLAGLLANEDGPTRRLLLKHSIDEQKLAELVNQTGEFTLPSRAEYKPEKVTQLPALMPWVQQALMAARDIADRLRAAQIQSRHLLYGALSITESQLVSSLAAAGVRQADVPLTAIGSDVTQAPQSIAPLNSDNPEGNDLLNIRPDVHALSAVIAAKDVTPPLSIGLFGDWGSGKSFFMRKMDERVRELMGIARQAKGDSAYCENVVQIWFNAWSYQEMDLWASLVTEIFEELARSIDSDAALAGGTDVATAKARLLAATASARDVLAEEEKRRDAARAEVKAVEDHIERLRTTDEELAAKLGPAVLMQGAYRAIAANEQVGLELDKAAERLNIPEAERATADLKVRLLEVKNIWSALGVALQGWQNLRTWVWPVLLLVGVALLLWVGLPLALNLHLDSAFAKTASVLASVAAALTPVITKARGALTIVNAIKTSRKEQIEKLRQQIEEKPREQQKQVRQKLTEAEQQVEQAKEEVQRLEQNLNEMRADKQLLDFIRQRSLSTDYTSRLGTVARARRDFKQLSDLLDRNRHERQQEVADLTEPQPVELSLPRIDRIVLYIDDLDRCSEDKVVSVLEAVHLLLAFRLFVVIVAVDSRWLLHSLRQHSSAFRSSKNGEAGISDEELAHWESTTLSYLEKIFQIPFYLRPMREQGFKRLIDEVVGAAADQAEAKQSQKDNHVPAHDQPAEPIQQDRRSSDNIGQDTATQQESNGGSSSDTDQPQEAYATTDSGTGEAAQAAQAIAAGGSDPAQTNVDTPTSERTTAEHGAHASPAEANPAALRLQTWESEFMKKLHPLINSPRSAKRYINIYRLMRVSIDKESELAAFVGDKQGGQHRAALLLLAILTGYPAEATDILRDLLEEERPETWWQYIDSLAARWDSPTQPSTGGGSLSRQRRLEFIAKLRQLRGEIPETQSCQQFVKWASKVARYSFESGRVLAVLSEEEQTD